MLILRISIPECVRKLLIGMTREDITRIGEPGKRLFNMSIRSHENGLPAVFANVWNVNAIMEISRRDRERWIVMESNCFGCSFRIPVDDMLSFSNDLHETLSICVSIIKSKKLAAFSPSNLPWHARGKDDNVNSNYPHYEYEQKGNVVKKVTARSFVPDDIKISSNRTIANSPQISMEIFLVHFPGEWNFLLTFMSEF